MPDLNSLYCDTALSSTPQRVTSLDMEDFLCPYSESVSPKHDCDSSCTCYINPFNFTTVVDCSLKNLIEIPTIWPVQAKRILLNDNNIRKIEKGHFSHSDINQLEELHLHKNSLNFIEIGSFLNMSLKTLKLHSNHFETIDLKVFDEMPSLMNISLYDNPWECDCTFAPEFKQFINSKRKIIQKPLDIFCIQNNFTKAEMYSFTHSPDNPLKPESFLTIPLVEIGFFFCKNVSEHVKTEIKHSITIPVTLSAVFVLISLIGISVYMKRLLLRVWIYNKFGARFHHEDDDNEAKPYDVFIAHTAEDWMFVVNAILPELEETEPAYKVREITMQTKLIFYL